VEKEAEKACFFFEIFLFFLLKQWKFLQLGKLIFIALNALFSYIGIEWNFFVLKSSHMSPT